MSYEKINNLIDQASDVSQWWVSSKRPLMWWMMGLVALQFPAFLTMLMSFGAILLGVSGWINGTLAVNKQWIVLTAPLVLAGGWGVIDASHKIFTKRFTHNGFKLRDFPDKESASLDFIHRTLTTAVRISDPQMKPVLARLHNLKDVDLPKCWWKALAQELDHLAARQLAPNEQPAHNSMQEKMNAVYVEIQQSSAAHPTTKVFRL